MTAEIIPFPKHKTTPPANPMLMGAVMLLGFWLAALEFWYGQE